MRVASDDKEPGLRKTRVSYLRYLSTQTGFVDIEAFRMHDLPDLS